MNKTYIFSKKSDGEGYVLLNVTNYPESIIKMIGTRYNYGTLKERLAIEYILTDKTKERWPNEFTTDFFKIYPRTEEQLDSFFRILRRKPEKGDEDVFSQMQFISVGSE